MKLRYKGKIKELNHIIISDPSYDESVTCRYENNNLKEKDWYVDIDIKPTVGEIEDLTIKGTEFFLFLSLPRCSEYAIPLFIKNTSLFKLFGIHPKCLTP